MGLLSSAFSSSWKNSPSDSLALGLGGFLQGRAVLEMLTHLPSQLDLHSWWKPS